jgi:ribonucleoside-diphosphate reductase alpha chain
MTSKSQKRAFSGANGTKNLQSRKTVRETNQTQIWPTTQKKERGPGLAFDRHFTKAGHHPFDEVVWEKRDAAITDLSGKAIFSQKDVEFPASWSQTATAVVSSKYFRGHLDSDEREKSVKQLISRVTGTISEWGRTAGYFATEKAGDAFEAELTWLILHQRMAFNSPVWFNVGVEERPQCSACFINSVDDSMSSILGLAHTEGMLFKHGSGAGSNLSRIRSSREFLAGGGEASGPVSFMRGFDAFAGVIKSGGKTRRAAKMVILDIDHPDVVEFIECKQKEEKKAWALIDAGYDGSFNGEAYNSVFFQNSNNSVRVTDEFMQAVENDGTWTTHAITDGRPVDTYQARELMDRLSKATWLCGDPGMQFDTTINDWHTCGNTDRINASNPCSEYMFLDDSACNLASLNLMSFVKEDGEFDIAAFRHAARLTITAQEILVDFASYPTEKIAINSHAYRPLGLGFANLGALLMTKGLAYDSEEGRNYAAGITALMHGEAYAQSASIASQLGPFSGYAKNRNAMLRVMNKHRDAIKDIDSKFVPTELQEAIEETWDRCISEGEVHGWRNSQVTVLAPTGTIAFMMDCDTTGVEPDIALVKYKKLVGGGLLKIVNRSVPEALEKLGYSAKEREKIEEYIDKNDTIEGAPCLKQEHLAVFDCAFVPANGERSISPMGHLRMMAAVQPFLSGAISKTVNLPKDATEADITDAYMEAWRMGVKAVAVYRDGCKRTQPLNTSAQEETVAKVPEPEPQIVYKPIRRKLPDERQALTHKFGIAGHEGYVTVGLYEDGTPGELFIVMAKEGFIILGLLDNFATSTSLALQYGVPLKVLIEKFSHTRYEPSGFTSNPDIRFAKSISDYIFRWLDKKFGSIEPVIDAQPTALEMSKENTQPMNTQPSEKVSFKPQLDSPPCHACGSIMVRNGACYKCANCGETSGCS